MIRNRRLVDTPVERLRIARKNAAWHEMDASSLASVSPYRERADHWGKRVADAAAQVSAVAR